MAEDLRTKAIQAVAESDPTGPGGLRLQAVKRLRDGDHAQRRMHEYIAAVDWAIEHGVSADVLPDGSVLATAGVAYIKYPIHQEQCRCWWRGTNGETISNEVATSLLRAGAKVLRHGAGEATSG